MLSDDVLKHVGIKGMRWGIRRNRDRPGGADGKEESTKVIDKRGNLKKNLDSLKRERQWNKVLKEVDKLTTQDINTVTKRISLENNLKNLSKTRGVGTRKDRDDYLRREHMSDAELTRKVVRLRAKDGLHKAVKSASKEQRDFGEKVVRIGGSLGVKYALKRSITPKDFLDAMKDPKDTSKKAKEDLLESISDKNNRDILSYALNKIDKPDKK